MSGKYQRGRKENQVEIWATEKCWTFRLDDLAPLVYEIAALDTVLIVNESFIRNNKGE